MPISVDLHVGMLALSDGRKPAIRSGTIVMVADGLCPQRQEYLILSTLPSMLWLVPMPWPNAVLYGKDEFCISISMLHGQSVLGSLGFGTDRNTGLSLDLTI